MERQRDVTTWFRTFFPEEEGPTVMEYAVLLVLIVLGVFSTLMLIGAFLRNTYLDVSSGIPEG